MEGQMTIFDFLNTPKPGDWLDDGSWTMGPPVGFDQLTEGMLVWANKSTESMEWWKCLQVDHAYRDSHGEVSRWIMSDGTRQQEYHSRLYFDQYARPPLHGGAHYRAVL